MKIDFTTKFLQFIHRHACATVLLGLNQPTAFATLQSKLTKQTSGEADPGSRLWKRLLFVLFNLRPINKHEQIREEFKRNKQLKSADFYNFDRKVVFQFLSYLTF